VTVAIVRRTTLFRIGRRLSGPLLYSK
jgi:hypothetical protein